MPLYPLYVWLFALNTMCLIPFTYGPLTFACLLISVLTLWRLLPGSTPRSTATSPGKVLAVLAIGTGTIALLTSITALLYQPDWLVKMGGIIDIGANTYAATQAFADGLNPYTHKTQLWVNEFPSNTPHLVIENGQVTMFGIPYYHGYPYFPLMFLSYLPAYFVFDGYTAIRITHIVLLLLNIGAFKLLCDKWSNNKAQGNTMFLIALTAYFGLLRYSVEAVLLGVTDILISTYLLYCFVALSYQRFFLAGVLLGCAQACKLLPAPFIAVALLWLLYGSKNEWRFLSGFVLACAVLILPFLVWHPQGFISSTILYYLTHHQEGDMTSLWFFLTPLLQTPFAIGGLVFSLASIFVFNKKSSRNIVACMAGSFSSYVIFMAFSKMTHLNYLWGVFPLGCLALTAFMTRQQESPGIKAP